MKLSIAITIAGQTGSGKSIMARSIADHLKLFGAKVTVRDDEVVSSNRAHSVMLRLAEQLNVTITTEQAKRAKRKR